MSSALVTPEVILGGGTGGNPAGLGSPGQLEVDYENLLTGAADIEATGAKILVLAAGGIGTASLIQIGETETAAEVASNAAVLGEIAQFCTAHGITIDVLANLTNSATYGTGADEINAEVDQWATAAALANLPISSITDVQEIGFSQPGSSFSNFASIEVNAVHTVIADYASSGYTLNAKDLSVGDMECGGAADAPKIAEWWSAYDQAAAAVGLPTFTSFTSDINWDSPWINAESTPSWEAGIEALAQTAASFHMAVNVTIQGNVNDTCDAETIQQVEQNAIIVAQLQTSGALNVNNLTLQSWTSMPVTAGAISSPTSMVNAAAEIAAVYPLVEAGLITARGSITVSASGQLLLITSTGKIIDPLSVQWDAADVAAGNRLGVVLIDQTGTLTASKHGTGTVSNPADNILILSGNSADLAAELASIALNEPDAGADTIDIETYGSDGRLSDNQIAVLAAAPAQSVTKIISTNSAQGWTSLSASINSGTVLAAGSVMTSETLYWATSNAMAGQSSQAAFINSVGVHAPLYEYGIANVATESGGTTATAVEDVYNPAVDDGAFPSNGYANNPGVNNAVSPQTTGWVWSYSADQATIPLVVESTTNTFNAVSGSLETSVAAFIPDPLTIVDETGTHSDTFATQFATGGSQAVVYNTGDNPQWKAGWGDQFSSVTITYSDTGQMVEEFFQGAPANPAFTLDEVFNPANGQLWEVFNSVAPPPEGSGTTDYLGTQNPFQPGYVSAPVYATQFEGSPNWDRTDWGNSASADTEVWSSILIANVTGYADDFAAPYAGDLNNYPLEFVNGTILDLLNLPGSMTINLNALGTATLDSATAPSGLSGLTTIDAFGASGIVTLTGLIAGGTTLVGGSNTSLLTGYGHDTFVASQGITEIYAGGSGSTIEVTSAAGSVTLAGNNDIVYAVSGSTLSLTGIGETVTGSDMTISVGADTSVTVNGSNDVIILAGTDITIDSLGSGPVAVRGSAATVAANIDTLEQLAANGQLASITFTDSGTPVLSLAAGQVATDAAALAAISSLYTLDPITTEATVHATLAPVVAVAAADVVANTNVSQPPAVEAPAVSSSGAIAFDTTTDQPMNTAAQPYIGPVAGLQNEYVDISSDSLNITTSTPNWFLHSGSGEDALAVNSGTNVMDGGTGSNFLVGGTGTDTFFADARGAMVSIWDTVVNFHAGDTVTLWSVTSADFAFAFADNQGAAGYTGLTMTATAPGKPEVLVTFAGLTKAALTNGTLSQSSGIETVSGSTYTCFHANA